MNLPENPPRSASPTPLSTGQPYLLRRLSIASLVAMFTTAAILIIWYQQDQQTEHEKIAAQHNEELAFHLTRLLDKQLFSLVSSCVGQDAQSLRSRPQVALFRSEQAKVIPNNIVKVKVYNQSGIAIYSSVASEIGKGSMNHKDWVDNALRGQVESHISFRDTFHSAGGDLHDVNISATYVPLTHAGKRLGVFEIYADATPVFKRIQGNLIRIALIVFAAFAVMYVTLFFSARSADHAISEWKNSLFEFNEKIRNLAFHDALTQLPNRNLLKDRMEQAMAASKRSGRFGALMFLDLDNFKSLNDAHGHGAGDLLLVEGARRLNSCVREADTVARFGGDEFVVVLNELDVDKDKSTARAIIVAEKIRAALAEPYVLKIQQAHGAEITIEHHCTSSIGVVLFVNHEASAEDILKWADIAMYQAKEAGRNLIRLHYSKA